MKHPYSDYTTEQALNLARLMQHGPGVIIELIPLPSVSEAIKILREAQATANFNWITGRHAIEVLQMELDPKYQPKP